MSNKIIIAVGSTGGHFFPGLRIACHAREKYGIESIFLGPIKSKFQTILKAENFPFVNLSISQAQKNIITTIFIYYMTMVRAIVKSFIFLCRARPKLVIGMGSFGSFPACISAYLLKVPLFLHEQNIIPGKANKFLAKFSHKIFLAFPGSSFHPAKTLVVGNPVVKCELDLDKQNCYKKFGLDTDKKTLLIFGGSQGAFSLNTWVVNILPQIANFKNWQVIHIAGDADCKRVKGKYINSKIHSVVLPFLFPMDCAYLISDLAIARGGALSLSELSFWGIASLIVPYSYAKDNHQEYNAFYFQKKGGAYLLKITDVQNGRIPKILQELLKDSDKLEQMGKKMKGIMRNDALERICEEIKKEIDRNTVDI